MKIYTKQQLVEELKKIRKRGWVDNRRPGNAGGVGNTLEDLLGIEENNLPIPNSAEWELKCQRMETGSLTTLFHMEPSPRAIRFVPKVLLPKYGWPHEDLDEMSFRQTISGARYTDRGFRVIVDRDQQKVVISFNSREVDSRHKAWLEDVERRVGLGELNPQPYWGFDDLQHKAGTKLLNSFYVVAESRRVGRKEQFLYQRIFVLKGFHFDGFLTQIVEGDLLVDFDARTKHNHGTKFRIRQDALPELYSNVTEVI
ncbi:MAG: MvaI/BcnI restriction endonuclease family protein [Candidatus Omnitrophica bacterium]|nr:MvaI/BcnI restriction endonuclease family protein [Candidatus Omnitrophota bacterium]